MYFGKDVERARISTAMEAKKGTGGTGVFLRMTPSLYPRPRGRSGSDLVLEGDRERAIGVSRAEKGGGERGGGERGGGERGHSTFWGGERGHSTF